LAAHAVAADLVDWVVFAEAEGLALIVDEDEALAEGGDAGCVCAEFFTDAELVNVEDSAPGFGAYSAIDSDIGTGTAELGYWVHPGARGRGVATEAARLIVRHTLIPVDDGGLGLRRLTLRAAAQNVASQRVAERAGLRPAGV